MCEGKKPDCMTMEKRRRETTERTNDYGDDDDDYDYVVMVKVSRKNQREIFSLPYILPFAGFLRHTHTYGLEEKKTLGNAAASTILMVVHGSSGKRRPFLRQLFVVNTKSM